MARPPSIEEYIDSSFSLKLSSHQYDRRRKSIFLLLELFSSAKSAAVCKTSSGAAHTPNSRFGTIRLASIAACASQAPGRRNIPALELKKTPE
jgi:hypothetical protein